MIEHSTKQQAILTSQSDDTTITSKTANTQALGESGIGLEAARLVLRELKAAYDLLPKRHRLSVCAVLSESVGCDCAL